MPHPTPAPRQVSPGRAQTAPLSRREPVLYLTGFLSASSHTEGLTGVKV